MLQIKDIPNGAILWKGDTVIGIKGSTLPETFGEYTCVKIPGNSFDYKLLDQEFSAEDLDFINAAEIDWADDDDENDAEFSEDDIIEDEFNVTYPDSDLNDIPEENDWPEDPSDWIDDNKLVKEAVEMMEENEDEVECKNCFDLFPKAECIKTEHGYICKKCNQELHSHQGTNLDLIDADPFDLEYDDPRDPEDEEEEEVKEEPLDANEVRKHEAGIDENLKVITGFSSYKPWSGAIDTYNLIEDAGKLDELEAYLEECYPAGLEETKINDILWFDADQILKDLGIINDEDGEPQEESLKEDADVDYVEYVHSYCNALESHMDELRKIDNIQELKQAILNIVNQDPDVNRTYKKNKFAWIVQNKNWSSPANLMAYLDKAMAKAKSIEVKVDDNGELIKQESLKEEVNEKPWFMQQGEDGEPEYLGFAKSQDDMIDKMVKDHRSDSIHENTYIDELDKDTYEYIKDDLSEEEIKELDNYFGIEENLEEHINDRPADIESDQENHGVDNAVVDCKKYTLVAHSEDEKPVDCKLEKPALEEPLAGEEVDAELYEHWSDALTEELLDDEESLEEAKKDEEELPPDPAAVKVEVHSMLNNLVADEIEAINGYEEAKQEIIDAPIEHKDELLDTVDHIEDEEKEHIDELIGATTEIPFDKEPDEVKLEQEERLADEANKEIRAEIEAGEVEEEPVPSEEPIAEPVVEEELTEEKAKPEGDKKADYEAALKLAAANNKPVIYGYSNKSYNGKYFTLDNPIVCDNVFDETKKFKQKYKSCGTTYVAYPDDYDGLKESYRFSPEEQEEYNCDEDGCYEDNGRWGRLVKCGWCEDFCEADDCKFEADFGWLCDTCQNELQSHGGPLTFIEPGPDSAEEEDELMAKLHNGEENK